MWNNDGCVACERCGAELYGDDTVYDHHLILCEDCFLEEMGCEDVDEAKALTEDTSVDFRTLSADQYLDELEGAAADSAFEYRREMRAGY